MQIIHDINCLATEVSGDYLTHVLQLLSSCSSEVLDLVKQSILEGGKSLSSMLPVVINTIVDALVEKAVEVKLICIGICISLQCNDLGDAWFCVLLIFVKTITVIYFDEIQVIELVVSVTTLKVYLIVNRFSFEAFCLSAVGFETTEGNNCNL